MTSKIVFERLYWSQDWAHLSPESTVRVLPHTHCSLYNYFSIFVQMWPLIFCQHTIHQVIWPVPVPSGQPILGQPAAQSEVPSVDTGVRTHS